MTNTRKDFSIYLVGSSFRQKSNEQKKSFRDNLRLTSDNKTIENKLYDKTPNR
jgi:hypothetical protein